MKAIRWRKAPRNGDGIRTLTEVDGVVVRRLTVPGESLNKDWLEAVGGNSMCLSLYDANDQQIDAAAYALADLVATLRGLD